MRGYLANLPSLDLIIIKYKPKVIAIQETMLVQNFIPFSNRSYTLINKNSNNRSGGLAFLIHKSVLFTEIQINTTIPCQSIEIRIPKITHSVHIYNCYLSPSIKYTPTDFNQLNSHLDRNTVLLGDFNAHNPLWGGSSCDRRLTIIEDWIENLPLVILNDGTPTFLNYRGKDTSIDLSIVSSHLSHLFNWDVSDYTFNSDHFPILLSIPNSSSYVKLHNPKFQENSADWDKFETCINEYLIMKVITLIRNQQIF